MPGGTIMKNAARQDQRLEAGGHPAQERGNGEAEHGEEHQVAPAEPAREPPRHGRGERGGDQVEGDDPGDLVLGGREGAADLRQHQVRQRDGHAEQHVRQLHHQEDEPLPPADAEKAALRNRSAHLGDVSSCRRGLVALLPDMLSRFACKMGRPRRASALHRRRLG
jgi:hypothetical protein